MEYSYPLLRKILEHYKNDKIDLSEYFLYSCQHLLAPQSEMYKMFIEFGFRPENMVALGKAYSSNNEVVEELKGLGIKAIQPQFTGRAFDVEHTNNCQLIFEQVSDKNKNIVLDDGGYLIEALKKKSIYFAVEQTSSGFRKLEGLKLNFPVFNVARSKTKLTQESPIIGRIIFERVKKYINDNKLVKPKVTIIGLGPIGNSLLQIFSEESFSITGFDLETNKEALLASLKSEKPDIVIGATGTVLLSVLDLDSLKCEHGYHFISASSSDREFPVSAFRKDEGVHDDVRYKNFYFVNNGFPITFKGNKYEATPVEIEKTIALLMGSILTGTSKGIPNQMGIVDVPQELEALINQ
ncbi:MAG: hypothetical protein PHF79_03405 [Candidatus Pacebacteria bacterium]|nr:hypothetical protein [Candidatus Paceibacterota bacterium]